MITIRITIAQARMLLVLMRNMAQVSESDAYRSMASRIEHIIKQAMEAKQ